MTPDNRPNVYYDPKASNGDGAWVYRASSLGMCVRALAGIGQDYKDARNAETQAMLDRTAKEGQRHEAHVLEDLTETGWRIVEQQTLVEIPVLPGVIIRGHTDGIITKGASGKHRLLEVKSMSTKVFQRWQAEGFAAFDKYAYQISAYMHATNLDVVYVVKRREDGLVDLKHLKADQPPVKWGAVVRKVALAEKHRKAGSLPACDAGASEKYMCPLWYLHDEEDTTANEVLDDYTLALVEKLVEERVSLKQVEEAGAAAEKARKEVDAQIVNLVGGVGRVVTETGLSVAVVNGSNTTLDKDKLREALGADLTKYEKKTKYRYVRVKERRK